MTFTTHFFQSTTIPEQTAFKGFEPLEPIVAPDDSNEVAMAEITEAVYNSILAANALYTETYILRAVARLQWSPSKHRVPARDLESDFIDSGRLVTIFIDDVASLGITQVKFYLDNVLQNTESAAPWDYATTDGFGDSVRIVIPDGVHIVKAAITDSQGTSDILASFEVA